MPGEEGQQTVMGKARPYKLVPPLTRDSVITWDYNMKAFIRQTKAWRKFLPTGDKHTWRPTKDDVTNGLVVNNDVDGTEELRNDFANYLTCIATHCPANFFNTVMQESTSYQWIIDRINKTFNLQTKGEHFLRGN